MPKPNPWSRNAVWVLLLIAINGVVLFNAVAHDPRIGYDAADHLKYIEVLSTYRLPSRAETAEFFSPPLPYLVPAMLRSTGAVSLWGAGKAAQILNVLFSIGLTLTLISLCDQIRPGDAWLKSIALIGLGMLPVYYRIFAFVRGEPLLAFLCLFVVERTLSFLLNRDWNSMHAVALGAAFCLVVLSRQWGFFIVPAVALFAGILAVRKRHTWRRMAGGVALVFLIAAVSSSWFYLHLRENVGSARAFNRPPAPAFSFANKPIEFYFGLGVEAIFEDPVRPRLGDQLLPIIHATMWGDYWSTFVVYGKDLRDGSYLSGGALYEALRQKPPPEWLETNRGAIAHYLGRANLAGLVPTAILAAGIIFGAGVSWKYGVSGLLRGAVRTPSHDSSAALTLMFLVIAATIAGYGWFLLMYPRPDTIKAGYILQIFPLLAILSAEMLRRLRERSPRFWIALSVASALAILHNVPLLVTRYPMAW